MLLLWILPMVQVAQLRSGACVGRLRELFSSCTFVTISIVGPTSIVKGLQVLQVFPTADEGDWRHIHQVCFTAPGHDQASITSRLDFIDVCKVTCRWGGCSVFGIRD